MGIETGDRIFRNLMCDSCKRAQVPNDMAIRTDSQIEDLPPPRPIPITRSERNRTREEDLGLFAVRSKTFTGPTGVRLDKKVYFVEVLVLYFEGCCKTALIIYTTTTAYEFLRALGLLACAPGMPPITFERDFRRGLGLLLVDVEPGKVLSTFEYEFRRELGPLAPGRMSMSFTERRMVASLPKNV